MRTYKDKAWYRIITVLAWIGYIFGWLLLLVAILGRQTNTSTNDSLGAAVICCGFILVCYLLKVAVIWIVSGRKPIELFADTYEWLNRAD